MFRPKTEAIKNRRAKFFKSLWSFNLGSGFMDAGIVPGRFRKSNGNCNNPMCHTKFKRSAAKREEREEIDTQL